MYNSFNTFGFGKVYVNGETGKRESAYYQNFSSYDFNTTLFATNFNGIGMSSNQWYEFSEMISNQYEDLECSEQLCVINDQPQCTNVLEHFAFNLVFGPSDSLVILIELFLQPYGDNQC